MFVIAAALLGLIVLLATLQYKWLGWISDAERDRMKATLNTRASGFAGDFDSELTRAYLLFQIEPVQDGANAASHVAARFDRWQSTARYPRMIKDLYLLPGDAGEDAPLQRFNQGSRFLEPTEWPESMRELRAELQKRGGTAAPDQRLFIRTIAAPVWEDVPALAVPMHFLSFSARGLSPNFQAPKLSYTLLLLDREYMIGEMLPALAEQHFRRTGDGFDYQLAVVRSTGQGVVYHTVAGSRPGPALWSTRLWTCFRSGRRTSALSRRRSGGSWRRSLPAFRRMLHRERRREYCASRSSSHRCPATAGPCQSSSSRTPL
jgi:hypothetical protein